MRLTGLLNGGAHQATDTPVRGPAWQSGCESHWHKGDVLPLKVRKVALGDNKNFHLTLGSVNP